MSATLGRVLSVFALLCSQTTCDVSPDGPEDIEAVTAAASVSGSALLVVGSTTLNAQDTAIQSRLVSLGLTVQVRSASAVTAADAGGKKVVVISESAPPAKVNSKLRMIPQGMVVLAPELLDDNGMTSSQGTAAAQTRIDLVGDPLLVGTGLTVVSSTRSLGWGVPSAAAKRVATVHGDSAKATIFYYEAGRPMVGLSAPGPRVGWFGTLDAVGALTSTGWALFDAAIRWTAQSASKYLPSSIAGMRAAGSGSYELRDVVVIGRTRTLTTVKLFVQDAGGGDFSGMRTICSSASAAHPCAIGGTVFAAADGDSVTIQGTFVKSSSATGGSETFFIDTLTDNGPAPTRPAPAALSLTEVRRGATTRAKWFQRVKVALPTGLAMYDFSPVELSSGSTTTTCPTLFGFGMIPLGTPAPPALACVDATSQPPGVVSPDPAEILISTDFFATFAVSTDCRCTRTFGNLEPSAASTIAAGGTLSGILMFDVTAGTATGFQFVAPQSLADASLSALTQR